MMQEERMKAWIAGEPPDVAIVEPMDLRARGFTLVADVEGARPFWRREWANPVPDLMERSAKWSSFRRAPLP
jgi:hypothetical protein